jgi:hypothetical protein
MGNSFIYVLFWVLYYTLPSGGFIANPVHSNPSSHLASTAKPAQELRCFRVTNLHAVLSLELKVKDTGEGTQVRRLGL